MLDGKRILRRSIRILASLLAATTLWMAGSFGYGEWYAWHTEEEQVAVWSAYMNREAAALSGERGIPVIELPPLLIQSRTRQIERPWLMALVWPVVVTANPRPLSTLANLNKSTCWNLLLANIRAHDVRVSMPGRHRMVTPEMIRQLAPSATNWDRQFPGNVGYYEFSSVAFNLDRTQAVFEMNHYACGLCGHGAYVLMRKSSGLWRVVDEADTWIS